MKVEEIKVDSDCIEMGWNDRVTEDSPGVRSRGKGEKQYKSRERDK